MVMMIEARKIQVEGGNFWHCGRCYGFYTTFNIPISNENLFDLLRAAFTKRLENNGITCANFWPIKSFSIVEDIGTVWVKDFEISNDGGFTLFVMSFKDRLLAAFGVTRSNWAWRK